MPGLASFSISVFNLNRRLCLLKNESCDGRAWQMGKGGWESRYQFLPATINKFFRPNAKEIICGLLITKTPSAFSDIAQFCGCERLIELLQHPTVDSGGYNGFEMGERRKINSNLNEYKTI